MDRHPESSRPPAERRIYTVGELNRLIQAALQRAFPGTVWVRGEVQRLPRDAARRKHVYFELHEGAGGTAAGFQIPVALLEWDRRNFGLARYLDGSDPDLTLQDRLEVCLECRVDFYPPFGRLSLRCVGVDPTFTLGRLEARRREVLALLRREGLLERQQELALPVLPLRIGLITAAGSAAHHDFVGGLAASPYPFAVALAACPMSGAEMEPRVTAALARLAASGVDVVVLTRGGGSRGDLSWFDQKGLAVAIAMAPVPVVTAIGHEIDRSIADVVAHASCRTPTAAAALLVGRVDEAAARLERAAAAVGRAAGLSLERAGTRLERAAGLAPPARLALQAAAARLQGASGRLERRVAGRLAGARTRLDLRRGRLQAAAARRLAAARGDWRHGRDRLRGAAPRLAAASTRRLETLAARITARRLLAGAPARRLDLARLAGRLGRLGGSRLAAARTRLEALAGKARLLDPGHLLERGYTLTLDREGRLLRSAREVARGMTLRTRFQDGEVESVAGPGDGVRGGPAPRRRPAVRKGAERGDAQEEPPGEGPGQGTLFR